MKDLNRLLNTLSMLSDKGCINECGRLDQYNLCEAFSSEEILHNFVDLFDVFLLSEDDTNFGYMLSFFLRKLDDYFYENGVTESDRFYALELRSYLESLIPIVEEKFLDDYEKWELMDREIYYIISVISEALYPEFSLPDLAEEDDDVPF